MRLGEVFRYELGYRVRAASTWLYGAFNFLIAFWVVHVSADATDLNWTNAPLRIAETSAFFCGLFGLLVTAGLFADAALRDRHDGMEPLLFTTRLRPAEFLGGRFLAALLVQGVLSFATPVGLALASAMPYQPQEAFGPTRAIAYLQPMLLFVLPNLVLFGTILFAIAALSRRVVPVYAGAIAIFIGYLAAANYWGSITNPLLSIFADPLGINALRGMAEYWTALERNTRIVGFPAMLVWNRVLWLAISAIAFAVLLRTFRFRQRDDRGGAAATGDTPARERWDGVVPRTKGVFERRTRVRQTLAVMRQSLADVTSGRTFQAGFLVTIGLMLLWGWNVGETVYETVTWPVTHLIAGIVVAERAIVIPWLVIAVFAGELVWKDRETHTSEIADALPVRTGAVLMGRFLALVAIIVFFQLAMLTGGVLVQVLHGYYNFEPGVYLRILFGWQLSEYVLLAALAMAVHVLVNHKYVGHLLVLVATFLNYSALYGVHHLLIYNSGPALKYSDMNGFGADLQQFVWFKIYWAGWALLLGVLTVLFWVRGPETGVRQRIAAARGRFTPRIAAMTALAAAVIAGVGAFIFYNTNVLNEYVPRHLAGGAEAEYERRYSKYRDIPQPVISAAQLRIELYPEKSALDATGSYSLVNRTSTPIRVIHVETPNNPHYKVRSMTFDRPSKPEIVDPAHGYRTFALDRPLAPGESLRFSFNVAFHPRGFAHYGHGTSVVPNGSYIDRRLLPFIGYQPAFEVSDANARKRLGLAPKAPMPGPADAAGKLQLSVVRGEDHRIQVETIVGTPADQTVVVPGALRRSWTENGRRYYHYGTLDTFATSVFSARYAVRQGKWNDVTLEVFHHPPHHFAVDRMLGAMKSALDYYTTAFGKYPYRELRAVEIPPYSINARAFPAALALAEPNFIAKTGEGGVNLMYFGTVHEVAHQWWGGQVRPAHVRGRGFVSESLANYSAMIVTEKSLGAAEARRVYDFQMDRYLRKRGETGRDVPLLEVEDHPHISYGKGAVALYTLRERIGEEAMNTALRRFLAKFGRKGPPYATSLDLYAELRAVTPPALYSLLTDLFETITLWEVKTQHATARRLPDGKYEVTVDVLAKKLRATGNGVESETPLDEPIEVGIYAAGKETPFYVAPHRIRSGKQTIRVIVAQEPSLAKVDPEGKLIERERGNNVVEVESVR